MSDIDKLSESFSKVGFNDAKIKEIVKNNKVANALNQVIEAATNVETTPLEDSKLKLLHTLASSTKNSDASNPTPNLSLVSNAIVDGRLKTNVQLTAAVDYVKANKENATYEGLNENSGVGIELSKEDVKEKIAEYMNANKAEIEEKRYKHLPSLMNQVKNLPSLKWASPSYFKPLIDEQLLAMIGPKDERDIVKKETKKKKGNADNKNAKGGNPKASNNDEPAQKRSMFSEGFLGALHKVGENPQAYPELMDAHLKAVNGKVQTRFPPEPNGFLHIGHSKAILVNFGYAKYHDGVCYLRFDDTNPAKEEDIYFESIKSMVSWLGFAPWKITYSSDYFDQLYELAEKLIQVGKAYVDHSTAEEIQAQRGIVEGKAGGQRRESKWASQTVEENLTKFRAMRDGQYKSGEATLRMKQDLVNSNNPQMWDLIAYRIIEKPHPRTGDKWRIYPTYDFTHCLVDSFENITHSLCTTEFYLSRQSYEWLCDALHVFRPAQREYGRLNITGTVLSKRKIAKLVEDKYVRDWNDPRLFTLEAIKRRGVPPGAILSFISTLGVTRNDSNIQLVRFESAVRKYLEDVTPRLFFILDPVEVVLENLPDDYEEFYEIPFKNGKNSEYFGANRKVVFTKSIFIDRADFRDTDSKEFFRLTPSQPVGLIKVPYAIKVNRVETDATTGKVTKIYAHYAKENGKPKTFIHWLANSPKHNSPLKIEETRIHNALFKSENPSAHPEGFLKDINPDSEIVLRNTIIEPNFLEIKKHSPYNIPHEDDEFNVKEKPNAIESVRFQGMRVGYFALDLDSTQDKLILNRIVSLKEDSAKN